MGGAGRRPARAYSTRPSFPRETTALLGPPFGFLFAFKSFSFFGDFFAGVDLDLDFVAMRKSSANYAGEVNLGPARRKADD
jgi:hypothetical protein